MSATFLVGAALMGGCASNPPVIDKVAGVEGLSAKIAAANLALEKVTIAEARTYCAGFTVKSYDTDHGTQVEYMSLYGRCYLWHPGNRAVLPCKRKITRQPA